MPNAHLEILEKLVGFDTVSRNSNLQLIDWVKSYLTDNGVEAEILYDETGTKANLLATVGPADVAGVVLSGHTDVVPVDGQDWSTDPFKLVEKDGKVFGRGATDMKGFLACALAAVPDLVKGGIKRPVHFALSYDEEVGCLGVQAIVDRIVEKGPVPEMAFIGEPSLMSIVNGHKGSCGLRTDVTGLACHSAQPHLGVNAILAASDIMQMLRDKQERIAADPAETAPFDPPYTTISVGTIRGGTSRNTVAGICSFDWDIRATRSGIKEEIQGELDAYLNETLLPKMRERFPDAAVKTVIAYDVPPLVHTEGNAAEVLGQKLTGKSDSMTVPYGSEAGFFQEAGMATVICGPGNIEQAHKPDEFIAESELAGCMSFLEGLGRELAA